MAHSVPCSTAVDLALAAAKARPDCDRAPVVHSVIADDAFVNVDVTYSSKGYRALYEYRIRDGHFMLAQD